MNEVKSIIFDWGGVLIDDPAPGLISFCREKLGVSWENFERIHKLYLPEFQKGFISEIEFWKKVCIDLQVKPPNVSSLWGQAFRYTYSPKKEMFDLVNSLKNLGYKTAFLSNTEQPAMEYFYELNYQIFDVTVFSCEAKTRKPESKIYELTLNKLNVKNNEAIFIDDRIDYIEGAKKVGMNTILFKNPLQTREKLESHSISIY